GSATGVLPPARTPDIPGLETVAGAAFHSARWDHSVQTAGARVAIIGTGSSGVQIVCALAGVARRLVVFQRTAQWILPVPNRPTTRLSRRAFRRFPALNRLAYRANQRQLELLL